MNQSQDNNFCENPEEKGICTRSKCVKRIQKLIPPVHTPNLNDEEIWSIKTLPTDWAPISKPSDVIDNLTKSRSEKHELVKQEIRDQFISINSVAEKEIRTKGEYIKQLFDLIEFKADECNALLELQSDEEKLLLSPEDFDVTNINISRVYELYNFQLKNFYNFLSNLEKWRSENYKVVLQWAYKSMHHISYHLPIELQHYFEDEIQEINQMLLNNFRCYAELEVHLNLQAETSQCSHMQNFEVIKLYWKDLKKKQALIEFNKKKLLQSDCETMMLATEKGKDASIRFIKDEDTFEKMWANQSTFPMSKENALEWTKELQIVTEDLDACAKTLINLYKLAIVQVFEGYFEDLQELGKGLVSLGFADKSEIKTLGAEICSPTIEVITEQYTEELYTLQQLWEMTITSLKEKVNAASSFLNEAAHLWDLHFIRVNEVQMILLVELRKLIEYHDSNTRDMEIKVTIYTDILRQAADIETLGQSLKDIENLMDLRCKVYQEQYAKEAEVLQKYKDYSEKETGILIAELKLFLEENPKPIQTSLSEHLSNKEPVKEENPRHSTILPMQMKQCKSYIDAIDNWVYGLWEVIEKYMSNCTDESQDLATKWIEEYTKKVTKRYELKFSFHISRFERLKESVFEIRRLEVTRHNDRLERHRAGAENEIALLKDSYSSFEEKYNSAIDEYKDKINQLKSKRKDTEKVQTVRAQISQIKNLSKCSNDNLKKLSEELKTYCDDKLNYIRQASMDCCRKVKLFAEDGTINFAAGKKIVTDFKKFDNNVLKKFNAVLKEISGKETKMFQQMTIVENDTLAIFRNYLEELEFSESVLETIKKLQVDIRTEVYSAKFLQKRITSSFRGIEEQLFKSLGNVENLGEFEDNFNCFMASLNEISEYLYQGPQIINANNRFCEQTDTPDGKDYIAMLFELEPVENETFSSKICCLIYKSLQELESEAKTFYNIHKQIENENKVQPTFGAFMDEVFEKYTFYHLQCELVWLDEVNDYLNSLYSAYQFLDTYHKQFLATLSKNHAQKLREDHEGLLEKSTEMKDQIMLDLMTHTNKLRTIHGYKSNRNLLDILEKEMEDTVNEFKAFNIEEFVQPHKETQDNVMNSFLKELADSRERLEVFGNEIILKILDDALLIQFDLKRAFLNNLINSMPKEGEMHYSDGDKKYSYCEQIRNITVPADYESITAKFNVLKNEPKEIQYSESETDIHPCKLQYKFEDEFKAFSTQIECIQESWYKDIEVGYKMFKNDVKRVIKLADVRYKNELPETME